MPVLVIVVQSITDHKSVGNIETDVIRLHGYLLTIQFATLRAALR